MFKYHPPPPGSRVFDVIGVDIHPGVCVVLSAVRKLVDRGVRYVAVVRVTGPDLRSTHKSIPGSGGKIRLLTVQ